MTRFSKPHINDLDRDAFDRSKDVVWIVDAQQRICYCNPAWDRFALNNGGDNAVAERVVGADLMSFIPTELHDFYQRAMDETRRSNTIFDVDFECSSAELYRLLHMMILPVQRSGELVFVSSPRREFPHSAELVCPAHWENYANSDGIITMCCHCRRTRRCVESQVWDWVPDFLTPEKVHGNLQISHGMCPICVSYFYSDFLGKSVTTSGA